MIVTLPGALFQEALYLDKDLRNGRGLWKHGLDVLRVAVDVIVFVYIRLSVGVAPRMTGGLVEPNLEELGVLELERLGLVSKTQGDPVGDSDQLSTSFESDSSRKRVALSNAMDLVPRLVAVIVYFVKPSMVSPLEMSGLCTIVIKGSAESPFLTEMSKQPVVISHSSTVKADAFIQV
jgi:hypothetical protein